MNFFWMIIFITLKLGLSLNCYQCNVTDPCVINGIGNYGTNTTCTYPESVAACHKETTSE